MSAYRIPSSQLTFLRSSLKILCAVLIICIGIAVVSWQRKTMLPDAQEIHSELFLEPVQSETEQKAFIFEYEQERYGITPVKDYEIRGLIVSHNNIHSIGDIYHDSTSVDFKDLCLIWGKNLETNNFKKISFWSEPWSCSYQPSSPEVRKLFNHDQLSNNHLLSDRKEIRDLISKASIGDQIVLKGFLINYVSLKNPARKRASSLVRTDTGNGACETVFVKEATLLKRGNLIWYQLFGFSKTLAIFLIVIIAIIFCVSIYGEAYFR